LKKEFLFENLVESEKRAGKTYTDIAISPMALGQLTDGVSLLRLASSYTVFPSEGILSSPRSYIEVKDHKGNVVLKKEHDEKRVFKESTARIMNKLLSCVVDDGTARSVTIKEKYDTAGKTGTSGNNKDKLFVGYTPYYTAGIWCGYENGEAIGRLTKNQLVIWDEIMTQIHEETVTDIEKKHFSDEGLVFLPYCKDSGKLYSENCLYDPRGDRMEYGYFAKENIPKDVCTTHVLVYYDTEGKGIAHRGCPKEDLIKVSLINVVRSFPCETVITDAEFVYRDCSEYGKLLPENYPYFYGSLENDDYAGISDRKKQFNSFCQKHS